MKKYKFWEIAFRLEGQDMFTIVPNPKWAWAADPFLVELNNEIYLFAELFLYKSERNAVLGYSKYENGCFGEWNVSMDKHWHLSYPNVFVKDNCLYMCPESYQNDEVAIYRLQAFPDKWEKVKTIKNNCKFVDTTFLDYEGKRYMFTYDISDCQNKKLLLCELTNDYEIVKEDIISYDDSSARPGGNFIIKDGELYRVSQNCEGEYGKELVISKVLEIKPKYRESIFRRISPKDIKINNGKKYIGVHTYNKIQNIEVIDLKYEKLSLKTKIAIWHTHKVFVNKYRN